MPVTSATTTLSPCVQMRTALLIHRPGQEQGQRIEHMTSHVDVAPTVLPWLGVENTKELLPQNKGSLLLTGTCVRRVTKLE